MDAAQSIKRWTASAADERKNYQLFLTELCDVLRVERPRPAAPGSNDYVFERDVELVRPDGSHSNGRIDLYKRGHFVLEAKQGAELDPERQKELSRREAARAKRKKGHGQRGSQAWDDAMVHAREQAERYARALPVEEGWPPFIVVVDVGYTIELFADFSRSGKRYIPFPDPRSWRIRLADRALDAGLIGLAKTLRDASGAPLTSDAYKSGAIELHNSCFPDGLKSMMTADFIVEPQAVGRMLNRVREERATEVVTYGLAPLLDEIERLRDKFIEVRDKRRWSHPTSRPTPQQPDRRASPRSQGRMGRPNGQGPTVATS